MSITFESRKASLQSFIGKLALFICNQEGNTQVEVRLYVYIFYLDR